MFWHKHKTFIMFISILAVLISLYYVSSFMVFIYTPATSFKGAHVVDIPHGASFRKITDILKQNRLVKDKKRFLILARLTGADKRIQSGELQFDLSMTPMQVLDKLMYGVPVAYAFIVPEGTNIYQIGEILKNMGMIKDPSEFVSAAKNRKLIEELGVKAKSMEGYLFPDTYNIRKTKDVKDIIRMMHKKYKNVFNDDLLRRAYKMGLSEHETVTLASIIEKETGAPEERKLISSVFHNRLKKGMPLQSDPTTIYGLWENYDGNLTKDKLQQYTPYNTYKIHGLPVGPIANPGKESIVAALYPDDTDYLFFVSKNDGTHTFTIEYKDHLKAVGKYQLDAKQRQGKSWRDLKNPKKQGL
ncbi:MAG TPA: endolytic transglycosylase MltG [bacterium]|nr:endolytic transglycosylase MltG [bacterium]